MAVIVIQMLDAAHEIACEGAFDAAADRPSNILAAEVDEGCLALVEVEIGDSESARDKK
jgi:hypothetical protein